MSDKSLYYQFPPHRTNVASGQVRIVQMQDGLTMIALGHMMAMLDSEQLDMTIYYLAQIRKANELKRADEEAVPIDYLK